MTDLSDHSAPTVSITSAFYNTGTALLDMIASIQAQTFEDWELVLLDDGSTDNSLELARSVTDARIRIDANERNLGRGASLNRLRQLARGRYIARMDADDMCAPPRIEKQVAYLNTHSDVDVVGTAVLYIDGNNRPLGWRSVPQDHEQICRHPSRMFEMVHGSILARRTWFEEFPYDESIRISVDSNLFFRSHRKSRFGNIAQPMYYYRYEPSFNLRKQWSARRASARYLFAEHKADGQVPSAYLHWVAQHAKFAITATAFAAGLRRWLMARRYQPLTEEQLGQYEADLERIWQRRTDSVRPESR